MKKLLSVLLVAVMMLTLTACGGGDSKYNGKYVVTKVKSGDTEYKKGDADWDAIFGDDDSKLPYIVLKDDGKCSLCLDAEDITEASYSVSGDTITFSAEGEKMDATIKGDDITLDLDGESMVLTKK